jgi:hypothetical protein
MKQTKRKAQEDDNYVRDIPRKRAKLEEEETDDSDQTESSADESDEEESANLARGEDSGLAMLSNNVR